MQRVEVCIYACKYHATRATTKELTLHKTSIMTRHVMNYHSGMAKALRLWERANEGMYGKERLASIADGYESISNTVPLYLYFGSMMSLCIRTHSLTEIPTRVKWNTASTTRQRAA